ncbi:hypothetical protein [Streptomyces sp. ME19-01-6]|uniref:hypothetical protein n=1 Tax=Streptomyces sp. ME19-01-6 TaxID=3028686 RepID=UPI00299FA71B|nr:hypothetical protein [Streptomyces sp. ME19-01-6]MDX3232634.1 hypothetical protein [Streptomyces sp. ME19-01-6]
MTVDLSYLATAAKQWTEAAKQFSDVQKLYQERVKSVGTDGSWTGQANLVSQIGMDVTDEQFTAAQTEAKAMASILRDAHSQFVELRGKVKSAVADAVKAGMKVSDAGIASYDFSKLSEKEAFTMRHDPGLRTTEQSWTEYIAAAVKAVDDADQGVKLALKAAVRDPDPLDGAVNGFNDKAEGDIEKVEAKEAEDLATKLNSGDKLSGKEMAEFRRLFRDNEHDKAFSQTFLAGLGPKGVIQLNNKFHSLGKGDDKKDFTALQTGVATSIATATKSPSDPFYQKWREGLRKVGDENFGKKTNPLTGYQSFVDLMTHGKSYGKQFLTDVGDDIITLEKKDDFGTSRWTQWGAGHKDYRGDPLDTLLGIMGKQPDVATSYLDPGADGGNERLKYLLQDRDWPTWDTTAGGPVTVPGGNVFSMDDPLNRLGLGAALEAAATGSVPGTEHLLGGHTEAEARVMHDTITLLNKDWKGDEMPANLRSSLGHMLVDYTSDTHEILSRTNENYKVNADGSGVWNDDGTVRMAVSPEELSRIMRGVSEDPAAYAGMYDAERQYAAQTLAGTDFNHPNDRTAAINAASSTFGFYDGVSSDIAFDKRDKAVQWASDVRTAAFTVPAVAFNFVPSSPAAVPVLGNVVQSILYVGMYEWGKDQVAQAGQTAMLENMKTFDVGQRQVDALVVGWSKEHGEDADSGLTRTLVGSGQERHDSARREALQALGRPGF